MNWADEVEREELEALRKRRSSRAPKRGPAYQRRLENRAEKRGGVSQSPLRTPDHSGIQRPVGKQGLALKSAMDAPTRTALSTVYSDEVRQRMKEASQNPKMRATAQGDKPKLSAVLRSAHLHVRDDLNMGRPWRVSRTIAATAAITAAAGGVGYAYNVQLDQIPNYGDFTALFDQYRVTQVTAHVIPRTNTNNLSVASNAATATVAPLVVTNDPDDGTTPTGASEVLAYPQCQSHPGWAEFHYTWKPRAAIAAYGGAFTQFADFDGWCDCASDDVEWYALKIWQFGAGVSQTTFPVWDIFYRVDLEFRFVH